jgi:uncharacterized protein (UPF0276 family)
VAVAVAVVVAAAAAAAVEVAVAIDAAAPLPRLGLGVGWRRENAWFVARRADLGFVEILAEDFDPCALPRELLELRQRGVAIVPHGVSLSLGGAEVPDPRRLDHLAQLAERVQAPFVSEHIAFVRAGGLEAGHLLPVERSEDALAVLTANVQAARRALPVPLVLENIAAPWQPPDPVVDEAEFLARLFAATGAHLLLDLANLHCNAENHAFDAAAWLDRAPLARLAYVHVAGGVRRGTVLHDTHAHRILPPVFELLTALRQRCGVPAVLWEHDAGFGSDAELGAELDAVAAAVGGDFARGRRHVG